MRSRPVGALELLVIDVDAVPVLSADETADVIDGQGLRHFVA
jgi:hypothetical protein